MPILRSVIALVTLFAPLGLAGCGGGDASTAEASQHEVDVSACAADPRTSSYQANMSQKSQNEAFSLKLQKSDPAPPAKGDNTWQIQLVDAHGAPVNDATIDVVPFMPDHGHGTSIHPLVTPDGSGKGQYAISRINLWMPGLWQVTLHVAADGAADDIVLGFCITG
ncbi:MAG TPA: FixH family protein [Polyangiaceae bacterium]|nr:FixH family protein [Polyangiaceae bacterium]